MTLKINIKKEEADLKSEIMATVDRFFIINGRLALSAVRRRRQRRAPADLHQLVPTIAPAAAVLQRESSELAAFSIFAARPSQSPDASGAIASNSNTGPNL
jgi:hypothetical protein